MTTEQRLIAALRIHIGDNINNHPEKPFDNEISKERIKLARAQYDLEHRFSGIRKAMIALSVLIKDSGFESEMYSKEFWDREQELIAIYGKLKSLNYEKSFNAAFCPVIDEHEFWAEKVVNCNDD